MAQHDYNIANALFPAFRADLNAALEAILTNNSGPTAPTTTAAGMFWVDTSGTDPVLKIRNAANDGWITLFTIASGLQLLTTLGGTLSGFLTLHANPTANMHAATKQYVDGRVLRAGDTMTGILNLVAGSKFLKVGGAEGGELVLEKPDSGTSLASDVAIDIQGNKLRFFEIGGTSRGAYITLTNTAAGVGTNLLEPPSNIVAWGRWTGPTNPVLGPSFNVASVTRTAVGRYSVAFSSALPNTNYAVSATLIAPSNSFGVNGDDNSLRVNDFTTTSFTIASRDRTDGFEDITGCSFVVVR
jgi:hypothetical protein